nr:PH domain-containing protein [uncultured Flavobacterium sp.]
MLENIKKILNEDQDPKAIEKISEKLENILMRNEEVGYIAVQKNPVLTVFPDSIVLTNKRILILKPKNLGLSLDVLDYDWESIISPFLKEGILGAEFSFLTKNDITVTLDKLPKNQARKLFTYAKEVLIEAKQTKEKVDELEFDSQENEMDQTLDFKTFVKEPDFSDDAVYVAEVETIEPYEQVTVIADSSLNNAPKTLENLSKDELFEKLQNYKKLLDNGLILQGEYDRLKAEVLKYL